MQYSNPDPRSMQPDMKWQPVIGLEVHAQLSTETKIFCGCSTRFGDPPNQNTCPVCLGLPGALPVLNERAVLLGLRAALALNCTIPPKSIFARKNYFYPDLPKGYQISQFDSPLAIHGQLQIPLSDSSRKIRIRRIHLEEDAGKLIHEGRENDDSTLVDLNRSGIPLIEIVSEPDLRSPDEAFVYLKELKAILQFCDVSSASMEEGKLRCDANISLRRSDSQELGTRVEIKNLNSFRFVQKALTYEIDRQTKVLQDGKEVDQETRLFHEGTGVTETMRTKEESHDYRYFPDPDLKPLVLDEQILESIRASMPELPEAKRSRFTELYQLTRYEAEILTEDRALASYFEDTARFSENPQQSSNWILRNVLEKTKGTDKSLSDIPVTPERLGSLIRLMDEGAISGNQGKEVFEEMWTSGKDPRQIVRARNMSQITDAGELKKLVQEVLRQNPEISKRYKAGETRLRGVLVGLVMKATRGRANPALVSQLLESSEN